MTTIHCAFMNLCAQRGGGGGPGPQIFHGMNVVRKIFSHAIQSNSNMTMGGKEIREK